MAQESLREIVGGGVVRRTSQVEERIRKHLCNLFGVCSKGSVRAPEGDRSLIRGLEVFLDGTLQLAALDDRSVYRSPGRFLFGFLPFLEVVVELPALRPPPYLQTLFCLVVNRFLHEPLPPHWTTAQVCLIYKKKCPHDPANYRPIALLNIVYKLVARHNASALQTFIRDHSLMHHSQHGGMPNFRTMDHLSHVTAEIARCPQAYHFYIDFNKAFNSVPHPTLRRVLHHYRMPAGLVDLISGLHAHPQDAPLVNNVTPYHYLQTRGLRQGCPMSPVVFILYSNPLLHAAPQPSPLERPAETSAHAFIDDKLYRSPSCKCG